MSTSTGSSTPPARTARSRQQRHRARTFYAFTAPWILGFALLTVVPLGYALWLSSTNYDALSPHWSYVGADNYTAALSDGRTWSSLLRTLVFVAVAVAGTITVGLALAVLANQRIRGRALLRTLFYLPAVVPPVAAALTFRLLFDRDAGAVNAAAVATGGTATTWLTDPYAFVVLILFLLWGSGSNMVISLAALQGVPSELTDAARVDGAGSWQSFRAVTLPIISPVLFFQVITGVIFTVQTFVPALLLSAGGPRQLTTVPDGLNLFMVHVYVEAFGLGRLGYASALLWLLFVLLVVFTSVVFKVSNRWVHYAVGPEEKGRRK